MKVDYLVKSNEKNEKEQDIKILNSRFNSNQNIFLVIRNIVYLI